MTSRLLHAFLATVAVGYLILMVVMGAQPVQRQLVRAEARGLLSSPPEAVQTLKLTHRGGDIALARDDGRSWTRKDGTRLTEQAAEHLETGLEMLHRSAPVREIEPEELRGVDTRPFGLDSPAITVTATAADGSPLTVRFGALNPEGFLQYARIDGDAHTYLMSRFIGAEWVAAAQSVGR